MKKKILSIALVAALFAIAAMGTVAYYTDKDNADNIFTAGGVRIELIEQERRYNEDGTLQENLGTFTQKKVLMPIVGSAQTDPKDQFGLTTAENYVDKIVTIKNTGKSDAYIRAYFAIPSALDDGYDTFNAGLNTLHFNFGNFKYDDNWYTTYQNQWIWKNASNEWKYFETTIGEGENAVKYNVYFADYYQILAANDTTEQLLTGVYLDKDVDMDENGNYIDPHHEGADLSILKGDVHCLVYAVAVQAAGFDSVNEAVIAAFGDQFNPWGGAVEHWHN